MVYPKNFEYKVGFDKIRLLVGEKCLSPMGEEHVDAMQFSTTHSVIMEQLNQVEEFVQILRGARDFPTTAFLDVRHFLQRIRPEGTFLDEQELFDIMRSLRTLHAIALFFRQSEEEEITYPTLSAFSGAIPSFPQLVKQIDEIIDKYGRVKDHASRELSTIRREKNLAISSLSRNLQSILRSAQAEGYVDKDLAPTMRDGRLVIPVNPAFKRKIRGIVHDESATGKTVFIEPEAVVESNNRIRELESQERREIVRILTTLTDTIRPMIPDILEAYHFMGEIDFIRAKALFAEQIHAVKPTLHPQPMMDWHEAMHPLLYLSLKKQQKTVVPLDIVLKEEGRLLIISGPNAGGKSVCLKTVGLLQYMLQCGLLIPLKEISDAGLFSQLFIDIGDEQSIENDLSTYSSHLTNMKYFLKHSDDRTLLLIDEFGSGTEPIIGGAMAEVLLDRFHQRNSLGVITTHYQNLKQYAEETPGVVNAAMLYDRHLMQPLFKLAIGHPGSSFAVEIARKIGLPEEVIAEVSEKVGHEHVEMDKYLQDIVRDKRYWEQKRQNVRKQEKRLEELTQRYETDLDTINQQRKAIVKEAKAEAAQLLSGANGQIEKIIREIKEAQAEKERTKQVRQSLEEYKQSVEETAESDQRIAKKISSLRDRQQRKSERREKSAKGEKQEKRSRQKPAESDRHELHLGDAVRIKGQKAVGEILSLTDKQAVIALGQIKSTVKREQLERVSRGELKKEQRTSTFVSSTTMDEMHQKRVQFKQEIDVRGMRGDEALQAVTYFVDDAIQIDVDRVRILHGTGTGALRQLIREYLQTVQGIARFHDEHVQFGGAGITVVEIS